EYDYDSRDFGEGQIRYFILEIRHFHLLKRVHASFSRERERAALESANDMQLLAKNHVWRDIHKLHYRDNLLMKLKIGKDPFFKTALRLMESDEVSNNHNRNYSVLVQGKNNLYLSASGYDSEIFNKMKDVFMSCVTNKKPYNIIGLNHDILLDSLYVWVRKDKNSTKCDMKLTDALAKSHTAGINKDGKLKRMYSCAERRLVPQQIPKVQSSGENFVVLTKMEPCYMCQRVLREFKIPCIYFDRYNMKNRKKKANKYDKTADKLYDLRLEKSEGTREMCCAILRNWLREP
ncbi:MAG: hypothetical protein K6G54_00475, partial [Oscillospiraceae bacterium]|nr:hypothetical protein [Oscillospiraceae bacterium]